VPGKNDHNFSAASLGKNSSLQCTCVHARVPGIPEVGRKADIKTRIKATIVFVVDELLVNVKYMC